MKCVFKQMELNNTDFLETGHSSHQDRDGGRSREPVCPMTHFIEGPPKRWWAVAVSNLGRVVCNIPYFLLLYEVLLEGY